MPLIQSIVRNVIYPIYRGFKRDRVLSILEELEKNQYLSSGEIEELQWRKLQQVLRQVSVHVPYYREMFSRRGIDIRAISSMDDFRKIPYLTRNVINENSRALISGDPLRKGIPSSTGGSTGAPLYFYCDRSSLPVRQANKLRQMRIAGIDIGARQLRFWGVDTDLSIRDRFLRTLKNYFNNTRLISTFDMSDSRMKKYAAVEKSFKPDFITGYPSALALFSDFCRKNSMHLHKPDAVITGGETLYPEQRDLIEEVLSAPVFNSYGSREFADIAFECQEHSGLHIAADLHLVELIHSSGRPARDGELGEIVVTDLSNMYMPFIRYRTGDLAVASGRSCDCGRGLPLLERVEGRSFDTIRTPEGKMVGGFFWTRLSRSVPGIRRFQIEQKALNWIDFRVVAGPGWKKENIEILRNRIKDNCGSNMHVNFLLVDEIPLTPSGKSKFVISDNTDRLVIKSKIHKASVTGVEPEMNDCLRIDREIMKLANIDDYEKILIVDATNGARLETFAVSEPAGKGRIVASGAVANHVREGDEIGIMAFTWSSETGGNFSNILVDSENRFVRYLTEIEGMKL